MKVPPWRRRSAGETRSAGWRTCSNYFRTIRSRPVRSSLAASPTEGPPRATPRRWGDTVGWLANLLELFPDNPFTTGTAFVANGLVWLARHASGDLAGLHSMDGNGELIRS